MLWAGDDARQDETIARIRIVCSSHPRKRMYGFRTFSAMSPKGHENPCPKVCEKIRLDSRLKTTPSRSDNW